MKQRLERAVGKRKTLRVTTDVEGDVEQCHGYAVALSRNLLVVHELADFHLDGYHILRVKDVVEVRVGELEKTQDRILVARGVPELVSLPRWLKYGTWLSLFRSLQGQAKCVSVGSGLLEVNVFKLGTIQKVTNSGVALKAFDATGKWLPGLYRFSYDQVTDVAFDDEYGSVFYEYVAGR